MKLIIDIDDKTYETIKNAEPLKWDCPIESAYKAIKNGTPLKVLEQEPCDDVISRQAVLEGVNRYIKKAQSTGTKDDFISFEELVVKELPSVKPQEPFMNKPCVAHQVCHEDKVKILDKIRADIDKQYDRVHTYNLSCAEGLEMALGIIEKYKAESEDSHEIDRCR